MGFPFSPLKSQFRLHLQQLFSEACVIIITDDQMFGDLMMRPAGKTWLVAHNEKMLTFLPCSCLFCVSYQAVVLKDKICEAFPPSPWMYTQTDGKADGQCYTVYPYHWPYVWLSLAAWKVNVHFLSPNALKLKLDVVLGKIKCFWISSVAKQQSLDSIRAC